MHSTFTYSNVLSGIGGNSVAPRRAPNPRATAPLSSRMQQISKMESQGVPLNTRTEIGHKNHDEQNYWRKDRQQLTKDEVFVGMIIRAPYHEEDFADGKGSDLPPVVPGADVCGMSSLSGAKSHISLSNYGYVCSKLRYQIVVAKFKFHYLAIPLYT